MICYKCQSDNSKSAKFCSSCGAELQHLEESSITKTEPKPGGYPSKKRIPVFLVVAVVILGIWVIGAFANNLAGTTGTTATEVSASDLSTPDVSQASDMSWVPKGMSLYAADSDLAWVFDNKSTCSILGDNGCIHIKVVTNRVCASDLYVEVNELDKTGNIIGMTNATLGYLAVGQVAKLELDAMSSQTRSFQLAKIDCL